MNKSHHPHLGPTSSASFYPTEWVDDFERELKERQKKEDRLYLFGIAVCFLALGLNGYLN